AFEEIRHSHVLRPDADWFTVEIGCSVDRKWYIAVNGNKVEAALQHPRSTDFENVSSANSFQDYVYLGGHSSFHSLREKDSRVENNYLGCIQRIRINGRLIDPRRKPFVGDAVEGYGIGYHPNLDQTSAHLTEHLEHSGIYEVTGFKGCIQKLRINDRLVDLIKDAIRGSNVENCLSHPCAQPDATCSNRAECWPDYEEFHCACPLGYTGNHCQDVTTKSITEGNYLIMKINEMGLMDLVLDYVDDLIGSESDFQLITKSSPQDTWGEPRITVQTKLHANMWHKIMLKR
ncbi:uncharacterized protein DEA37_0002230, partial [Paragonimus westermani]